MLESMMSTPSPSASPTPEPTPLIAWNYDADGVMRVTDARMTYAAAIMTWLAVKRGDRMPEEQLARLRELHPDQVAALQPAQGNPPLFLREVRLPATLRILRERSFPVLVQVDDNAGFGPWCVLTAATQESTQVLDPLRGRLTVPHDDLADHLAALVAPFFDNEGIVGLVRGHDSAAVRALQKRLLLAGVLDGELTTVFDDRTAAALEAFRKRHLLPGSDRVDEAVAFALITETELAP
jgi:hypothetical protein